MLLYNNNERNKEELPQAAQQHTAQSEAKATCSQQVGRVKQILFPLQPSEERPRHYGKHKDTTFHLLRFDIIIENNLVLSRACVCVSVHLAEQRRAHLNPEVCSEL